MDIPPPPPRWAEDGNAKLPDPPDSSQDGSWMLNLGGPGWITDVFDVSVEFDNDVLVRDKGQKYTVPFNSCRQAIPMYSVGDVVSGTVRVVSPKGHEVTANMIKIKAEEYVCLLDPYVTNDMVRVEEIVCSTPVMIGGEHTFRFELDLSNCIAVDPEGALPTMPVKFTSMMEDYIGKQFGIKHALVVEIRRPWWTFDIHFHEPFAIYDNNNPAPSQSVGRKKMTENELEEVISTEIQASYLDQDDERDEDEIRETCTRVYEEGLRVEPHVLNVTDFPADCCTFDYGCDSVNMDDGITGALTIRNSRVDVKHMEISFYKIESIDGQLWESVLSVMRIGKEGLVGEGEEYRNPFKPAFEGKKIRIGFEGYQTQTSRPSDKLEIEEEGEFISPTLSKRPSGTGKNIYKHTMSVEYFFRLSIVTAVDECNYWDTNQIYIHRARMPEGAAAEEERKVGGGGSGV
mmetsp:Transcript_21396/g.44544  ORF Transcript_21396/g.44544 Transcript_21396/m.44544 type:complete len:459 (+) Transcript_21396:16-1392(+)